MSKFKLTVPPFPAVILAILSVQVGAAFAKSLFPVLGATGTSTVRIGISALILIIFNRPDIRKLSAVQWKAVIPYGLCLGAMNGIFYLALTRIPLGLAVALEFIGPLMLSVLTSKRRIDYLWPLLAIAGIGLITPWNGTGVDLYGTVLALLAGVFWAGYIVLGQRTSVVIDGAQAVSIGMIFALLIVLPFGIAEGNLTNFTFAMIPAAIALGLLCSAIPFSLEIGALKHIPAKTFSILMSLEPAVAAVCGLIFLKEVLSLLEWLAIVLVVAASLGATLTGKPEKHIA
ncbi:inner membrane transporter RhtA [Pedobacter westerhofensis]|uniref:Inner membrane transporter RhtA n=1 Tax=Pedobacter westerhofensis TaxID=425512 RepID=A0A521FBU8_9SPHI|nr:DMT family transporter [Pedobacter westerhofensis]SMO93554.1 inner membrane transporter RhtA [Pedobacter westerhofensis]